jgi:hypothetical protein
MAEQGSEVRGEQQSKAVSESEVDSLTQGNLQCHPMSTAITPGWQQSCK